MPKPALTATYIVALVTGVAGLFATQDLISNGTSQFVSGLAAAVVPPLLAIAVTVWHGNKEQADAHLAAAKVHADALDRHTLALTAAKTSAKAATKTPSRRSHAKKTPTGPVVAPAAAAEIATS